MSGLCWGQSAALILLGQCERTFIFLARLLTQAAFNTPFDLPEQRWTAGAPALAQAECVQRCKRSACPPHFLQATEYFPLLYRQPLLNQ